MSTGTRKETDLIGTVDLEADFPFGIHTYRAMNNFNFSAEHIRPELFENVIIIKKCAAEANCRAGLISDEIRNLIVAACEEILEDIEKHIPPIHPYQGGAGTSTNMAANELIANISLKNAGKNFGDYDFINPLNHVNLSQSTNDVYATAVRISILKALKRFHESVRELLSAFLKKEEEFKGMLKTGRTELQDAMPISLGQEFGAYADSLARFRWRVNKAIDWIRDVNLGGTAIGTGINADRTYASGIIEILRQEIKEPVSIARNLIDATQNADQIVEIMGILKTGAVQIKKICFDLRLLSSGPSAGFNEIELPALQAGSSIMPGKVNPVMLEAAEQIAIHIISADNAVAIAVSESNLELVQFMPFIVHNVLTSIELFTGLCGKLPNVVLNIKANKNVLIKNIENSYAVATLLAPSIGHEKIAEIIKQSKIKGTTFIDELRSLNLVSEEKLNKLLSPEIMASPGLPVLDEN
ncbi:MAG: aspartate ammonia-lyase [Spirochaetes bacterium]|nr:aspartate ammonia-lyase [Spirochaetota bacterium]